MDQISATSPIPSLHCYNTSTVPCVHVGNCVINNCMYTFAVLNCYPFSHCSRLIEEEGGQIAPQVEGRITMVGNS